MGYLFSLLVLFLLAGGFIGLTALEARQGVRIFAGVRRALDRHSARVAFIITHVDWSGVAHHVLRVVGERIAHDIAHTVLIVVRFMERFLTHAVRSLRARRSGAPATGNLVGEAIAHAREALRQKRRYEKVLEAPSTEVLEEKRDEVT